MKLKRKSLALMIGIACSGLLYGVNANAAAEVTNFNDATKVITDVIPLLAAGEISNNGTALSASNGDLAKFATNVGQPKMAAIANFEAYKGVVENANAENNAWYTNFLSVLTTDKATDSTNGLLGKMAGNLFTSNSDHLFEVSKNANGEFEIGNRLEASGDTAKAVNTLVNLIQLAQEAKAKVDNGEDSAAFDTFLKTYKDNLDILDIIDNNQKLKESHARDTFMQLVNDTTLTVGKEKKAITVSDVRKNQDFLRESKSIVTGTIQTKAVVGIQGVDKQTGAGITLPDSTAKLSTIATLSADLKSENDATVASKGTKISIKGNVITHGKDTFTDSTGQSFAYSEGHLKLNELGKVAIFDSNIQGESNRVVAKSEAIFKDGKLVNPADGITAYGNHNTIESNGIAIGNDNTVGQNGSVIGNNSEASKKDAIAIGNRAHATHANSIALGADSKTTKDNEVNVGGRTIGGVADATQNDEAVNFKQLGDANAVNKKYTEDKAGDAVKESKTYTNEQIKTAGTAANTYTNKQVSGLKQEMNGKIDALDKKVNKGFAANAALSGLFQPYGVGKINMTAGVGGYQSESAVAVGVGYRVNENVALKAGIATAVGNGSSTMYNASVNFEW